MFGASNCLNSGGWGLDGISNQNPNLLFGALKFFWIRVSICKLGFGAPNPNQARVSIPIQIHGWRNYVDGTVLLCFWTINGARRRERDDGS